MTSEWFVSEGRGEAWVVDLVLSARLKVPRTRALSDVSSAHGAPVDDTRVRIDAQKSKAVYLFFFKILLFFGCAGSLLLCAGFLWL